MRGLVLHSARRLRAAGVRITRVTSDEPEEGAGDGNTTEDIVLAADSRSVKLRSERGGGNKGRVYTITFEVSDASGNVGTATATVTVPPFTERVGRRGRRAAQVSLI